MKRSSLAVSVVILLAVVGTSLYSPCQSQNQSPRPARSPTDETLDLWNEIENKLVAMAQSFPEDRPLPPRFIGDAPCRFWWASTPDLLALESSLGTAPL
jgi:hypothetical protein